MDGTETRHGQRVAVFYQDSADGHVARKDGIFLGEEGSMIKLQAAAGLVLIPTARVIRLEVMR